MNAPRPPSTAETAPAPLGKAHARRLRDVWRSAGWPCHDGLEIELLAAGLLERMPSPSGHETVRRCIAAPDEVPPECGVLVIEHGRLVLGRAAPRRSRAGLPFGVWMALAKATPVPGLDDGVQAMLGLAA